MHLRVEDLVSARFLLLDHILKQSQLDLSLLKMLFQRFQAVAPRLPPRGSPGWLRTANEKWDGFSDDHKVALEDLLSSSIAYRLERSRSSLELGNVHASVAQLSRASWPTTFAEKNPGIRHEFCTDGSLCRSVGSVDVALTTAGKLLAESLREQLEKEPHKYRGVVDFCQTRATDEKSIMSATVCLAYTFLKPLTARSGTLQSSEGKGEKDMDLELELYNSNIENSGSSGKEEAGPLETKEVCSPSNESDLASQALREVILHLGESLFQLHPAIVAVVCSTDEEIQWSFVQHLSRLISSISFEFSPLQAHSQDRNEKQLKRMILSAEVYPRLLYLCSPFTCTHLPHTIRQWFADSLSGLEAELVRGNFDKSVVSQLQCDLGLVL